MTDWLMVIITAIYVVATIVICYFNGKSAKAAKMQTDEMIRQYNIANRPNVTIHFDIIRSGLMCFIIENEGNKPAHNVSIKINKEFINIKLFHSFNLSFLVLFHCANSDICNFHCVTPCYLL